LKVVADGQGVRGAEGEDGEGEGVVEAAGGFVGEGEFFAEEGEEDVEREKSEAGEIVVDGGLHGVPRVRDA
jgi:hypothetical protein